MEDREKELDILAGGNPSYYRALKQGDLGTYIGTLIGKYNSQNGS